MMKTMSIGKIFTGGSNTSRQVTIRKEYASQIPRDRLLSDQEWRHMGIQMSLGWEHYCIYKYSLIHYDYEIDLKVIFYYFVDQWGLMVILVLWIL